MPPVTVRLHPKKILQLLIKVKDVAVRVALAKDRDEAKDGGLKAEAFAVRADQSFGRQFRSVFAGLRAADCYRFGL